MTRPSSKKTKPKYFRKVPTKFKLFFFPVLGLILVPLMCVLCLSSPSTTPTNIVLGIIIFSIGMVLLLVAGGDFKAYSRFNESSAIAEAVVIKRYTKHDSEVHRTHYLLELKFTTTDLSGDAQEIRGILEVDEPLYSSKNKGAKIQIKYATQDPYVISFETATGVPVKRQKPPGEVKKPSVMCPTTDRTAPWDVFQHFIVELENEGRGYVTFGDQDDEKKWVQVKFEPDGTLLNFSYPYDEEPEQFLSKQQIRFPSSFYLESWEKQLYATFSGPRIQPKELVEIVDELFVRLLKTSPHYVVRGQIDY